MDAAIFDLDGCLCDTSSSEHLVTGEDKNYHAFHAASAECPPNAEVLAALRQEHADGRKVLVVSSREFIWRDTTLDWLARHEIPYDGLYLRIVGDYRKDTVVKNEIWGHLVEDGVTPVAAWDDKHEVLDLWAERGVQERHLVS